MACQAASAARLRSIVWPLLEAGRIKPVVHAVFPLAGLTVPVAAVAAMVLVERGRLKLTDPLAAPKG